MFATQSMRGREADLMSRKGVIGIGVAASDENETDAMIVIYVDVTRKLLFSPTDLLELPAPESHTCRFLRQIVPCGIRATSNLYGIEGFHLKDVLGVVGLTLQSALTTRPALVEVETRGELTRGMSVVDDRKWLRHKPNVDLAVDVDLKAVRQYISQTLQQAG